MEAALIKSPPVDKKQDDELQVALRANDILTPPITKKVYQEMIDIKRERAEKYQNQTSLFLMIGLSVSLLLIIVAMNWRSYDDGSLVDLGRLEADFDEMLEVPPSDQPPPPPPKIEQPIIVEVDDKEVVQEIQLDLDVEVLEETSIADVIYEASPMEEEQADQIFQIVEDYPTPKGGLEAFYTYVSENLEYPHHAIRMSVSGNVFVKFVVEKSGKITGVEVIKGIGYGCDEEAKRVIESAPAWNPGKQRGMPVRVAMVMPIRFVLQ
ncbi:MAG: energy transducer TonB [Bacteroidota bacterium]